MFRVAARGVVACARPDTHLSKGDTTGHRSHVDHMEPWGGSLISYVKKKGVPCPVRFSFLKHMVS